MNGPCCSCLMFKLILNTNELIFPHTLKGNLMNNNTNTNANAKNKKSARILSAGHVHVVVAATVRVVRKKLVSCKIDVGGVGRCGAVRQRIAPAIDDMLSPAMRGGFLHHEVAHNTSISPSAHNIS